MSTKIASLYAEVTADTTKLDSGLKKAQDGLQKTSGGFAGALKSAALFTAGIALAVKGLDVVIGKAADSERSMSRLTATLQATGRGAEISAVGIDRMAAKLMSISAFDDEAIVDAYNSLMKFENLPTGKMDELVKTSMDMTAALGGDLAGNAELIGRILETGTIPRTMGFSAALRDQVKALVDAGDKGEALNLVLTELNKRYSGQAAAQIETYSGKVERLKNTWENFLEAVGQAPMLKSKAGIDVLTDFVDGAEDVFKIYMRAREMAGADNFWYLLWPPKGGQDLILTFANIKNAQDEIIETEKWTEYGLLWEATLRGMGNAAGAAQDAFRDYAGELSFITSYSEAYTTGIVDTETALQNLRAAQEELVALQKAGWSESGTKITEAKAKVQEMADKLGVARDASKDATNEMISGFLQTQLAADGVFDSEDQRKVLEYRKAVGLLTEEEYNASLAAMDIVDALLAIPPTVSSSISIHQTTYTRTVAFGEEPGGDAPLPPGEEGWGEGFGDKGASGRSFGGRYAIVGDRPGGDWMTPYTELVDFNTKRVYNNQDTRRMLGQMGNVPRRALGGAPPGYNPGQPGYNQTITGLLGLPPGYAPGRENTGRGRGDETWAIPGAPDYVSPGGIDSLPSEPSGAASAVTQAVTAAAMSVSTVSAAAETISDSGKQTTAATEKAGHQAMIGDATIVAALARIERLLEKSTTDMPRRMAQAVAKTGRT